MEAKDVKGIVDIVGCTDVNEFNGTVVDMSEASEYK